MFYYGKHHYYGKLYNGKLYYGKLYYGKPAYGKPAMLTCTSALSCTRHRSTDHERACVQGPWCMLAANGSTTDVFECFVPVNAQLDVLHLCSDSISLRLGATYACIAASPNSIESAHAWRTTSKSTNQKRRSSIVTTSMKVSLMKTA